MDEPIDGLPALVDPAEELVDLAEVGEIDPREAGGRRLARRRDIGVPNLVAVCQELADRSPSQLAAATGDDDPHG